MPGHSDHLLVLQVISDQVIKVLKNWMDLMGSQGFGQVQPTTSVWTSDWENALTPSGRQRGARKLGDFITNSTWKPRYGNGSLRCRSCFQAHISSVAGTLRLQLLMLGRMKRAWKDPSSLGSLQSDLQVLNSLSKSSLCVCETLSTCPPTSGDRCGSCAKFL